MQDLKMQNRNKKKGIEGLMFYNGFCFMCLFAGFTMKMYTYTQQLGILNYPLYLLLFVFE